VLDYDERNYNLCLEFVIIYFEVQILVICNNQESNVGMNGNVKFVENLR
jgi:hypothetical protein